MEDYGISIDVLPVNGESTNDGPTDLMINTQRSSSKVLEDFNENCKLEELSASFHNVTISPEKNSLFQPKLISPISSKEKAIQSCLFSNKSDSGYQSVIRSGISSIDSIIQDFKECQEPNNRDLLSNSSMLNASADLFETSNASDLGEESVGIGVVSKTLKKTWFNRVSKGYTPPGSPRSPALKTKRDVKFKNGIHTTNICW